MATPLREWLKTEGHGAVKRLSARSGVPERSLYRYVDGDREPPLHQAVAISAGTGGAVRVEDMVKRNVATADALSSDEAAE